MQFCSSHSNAIQRKIHLKCHGYRSNAIIQQKNKLSAATISFKVYNISHLASFLSIYYKGSRHAFMKTKGRLQCLMRWGWSSLVFQLVQEPQFVFCCPIMSSSDGFFIFYQHHYLSLPAGLIISQTTGP